MYTITKSEGYKTAEAMYQNAIGVARLNRMYAQLASNPTYKPGSIEKMKGSAFTYRYRVGEYRAIYEVYEGKVTVQMLVLAPRGSVYG